MKVIFFGATGMVGAGALREALADATVEQLLGMKKGDFIELDRQPRIQATVDGVPIFECQYGTHNSKYAIRIEKALRGNDQNWLGERNAI